MHAQPLAEHDHFGVRSLEDLLQQSGQLVGLGAEIGFPVEQIGAVAGHAHVLERDHEPSLVRLGQEMIAPPFGHDPRDDLAILLVHLRLLGSHRHEEIFV